MFKKYLVLSLTILLILPTITYAGWKQENGKWKYEEIEDGEIVDSYHNGIVMLPESDDEGASLKAYIFAEDGYLDPTYNVNGYANEDMAEQAIDAYENPPEPGDEEHLSETTSSEISVINAGAITRSNFDFSTPSTAIQIGQKFNTLGEPKITVKSIKYTSQSTEFDIDNLIGSKVKIKFEKANNGGYLFIGGTKIYLLSAESDDGYIKVPRNVVKLLLSIGIKKEDLQIPDYVEPDASDASSLIKYEIAWFKHDSTNLMPIFYNFIQDPIDPTKTKISVAPIFLYNVNDSLTVIGSSNDCFTYKGKDLDGIFGLEYNNIDEALSDLDIKFITVDNLCRKTIDPSSLAETTSSKIFSGTNVDDFTSNDLSSCNPGSQCNVFQFSRDNYYCREFIVKEAYEQGDVYQPDVKYFSSQSTEIKKTLNTIKSIVVAILGRVIPVLLSMFWFLLVCFLCILSIRPLVVLLGKYFDVYKIFSFGNIKYDTVNFQNWGTYCLFVFVVIILYSALMYILGIF